jgi:hypothetical protein
MSSARTWDWVDEVAHRWIRHAARGIRPPPPPRSGKLICVAADDCTFFSGGMVSYVMISALLAGLLCGLAFGVRS